MRWDVGVIVLIKNTINTLSKMYNKILFLTFICSILIISPGCKKDESNNSTKTINVILKYNQPYQYDLGSFGDEEGATISRQASHFEISKIDRINYVNMIYTYKPVQDYIGLDEAELMAERGSDGASPNNEISIIIIKFAIMIK